MFFNSLCKITTYRSAVCVLRSGGRVLPSDLFDCISGRYSGGGVVVNHLDRKEALRGADLASMPRSVLRDVIVGVGEKRFRADQLFGWLHDRHVRDYSAMTDLPKALRQHLAVAAPPASLAVVHAATSKIDKSRKLVLRTAAGHVIESVVMPMAGGWVTQCLSSQVGCKMGCDFCATAEMAVRANLSAAEIVDQVAVACRLLGADGEKRGGVKGGTKGPLSARPHNLVFMGMGEPLDNFDALVDALSILTDAKGYGFSPRRITVSTSGLAKRIGPLVQAHPNINLAWSLTATTDEVRSRLMPVGRGVPIAKMMQVLTDLPDRPSRKITFEYALLQGVNDTLGDARRLAEMARELGAHVNAIPFNVYAGARYARPTRDVVKQFAREVARCGGSVSLRESKGQDIGAACGQLAGDKL